MDEAIIQLVKDFEKPSYKNFKIYASSLQERHIRRYCANVTGSENSAVLLALLLVHGLSNCKLYNI